MAKLPSIVVSQRLQDQLLEVGLKWQPLLAVVSFGLGYLVQFESLLSTHGAELGMLGDMDVAVNTMSMFCFSFSLGLPVFASWLELIGNFADEKPEQPAVNAVNLDPPFLPTIELGRNSNSIQITRLGMVWVLCFIGCP